MTRRSRLCIPNLPHHIVQRGHNRHVVFSSDADRLAYLSTLAEFRRELGVKVHAWCLMTNHVHLVVDPGEDRANLGRLMKRLAGRHTRRVNRIESKTGTAWEGRYKCSPIDSRRYLLACTRYVELNPVRAGVSGDPAEFRWSSYRSRMGWDSTGAGMLDLDPCFLSLGTTPEEQRSVFREWVAAGVTAPELQFIREALQGNRLTGTEEFSLELERQADLRIPCRKRGRPQTKRDGEKGTDLISRPEK
ncbi:MAG: transposase [Steroidobacteraceae bacterium]|jgi:putative transposase|nr:transposase [Steroidobacteraceae bacterium]